MQYAVRFDTSQLRQGLEREKRRLASTQRRAVNALAYDVRDGIREEMRKVFDRPTPYVLNGLNVIPARDSEILAGGGEAVIDWKPGSAGTIATGKILRAQIEGGARSMKRFERALHLPSGWIATPAKWAELDAHGNISGAQIVRILSALRLFGEVGYIANRTRRSEQARYKRALRGRAEAPAEYFVVPIGTNHSRLSPGIYRQVGNSTLYGASGGTAPLMIVAFVRSRGYRQRLNPGAVARRIITANASTIWQQALTRTLPFRR